MSALNFVPTGGALGMYRATYEGHVIGARKVGDVWEVTIDPQTPLMDRPYGLRSTYSCANMAPAVNAAMCAILDHCGIEGSIFRPQPPPGIVV